MCLPIPLNPPLNRNIQFHNMIKIKGGQVPDNVCFSTGSLLAVNTVGLLLIWQLRLKYCKKNSKIKSKLYYIQPTIVRLNRFKCRLFDEILMKFVISQYSKTR